MFPMDRRIQLRLALSNKYPRYQVTELLSKLWLRGLSCSGVATGEELWSLQVTACCCHWHPLGYFMRWSVAWAQKTLSSHYISSAHTTKTWSTPQTYREQFMSWSWLWSSCMVLSACVDSASDYSKTLTAIFEAEVAVIIFLCIAPHPATLSSHNKSSLQLLNPDCLPFTIEVVAYRAVGFNHAN